MMAEIPPNTEIEIGAGGDFNITTGKLANEDTAIKTLLTTTIDAKTTGEEAKTILLGKWVLEAIYSAPQDSPIAAEISTAERQRFARHVYTTMRSKVTSTFIDMGMPAGEMSFELELNE